MFSKHNVTAFLILILSLSACATNSKNVNVYTRDDVITKNSKVIVFPMLLARSNGMKAANSQYGNPLVDALLGKTWSDALDGKDTITIPKIALDKLPKAYPLMETFIKALDTASAVEQTKVFKDFANAITDQFGNGAFALALVFQNEDEYKATGVVNLNMGLFDTRMMTWKWITKHSYEKSLIPVPYTKVVQDLVSDSYSALKEKNAGEIM